MSDLIKGTSVTSTGAPAKVYRPYIVTMEHKDKVIASSLVRNGASPKLEHTWAYSLGQARFRANLRDKSYEAISAVVDYEQEDKKRKEGNYNVSGETTSNAEDIQGDRI